MKRKVGRFVGELDYIPIGSPGHASDMIRLESDYGLLRKDNLLVIAIEGGSYNGASIPRLAQLVVGSPVEGENKYWSVHHDALYNRWAVILNMELLACTPEEAMAIWRYLKPGPVFIPSCSLSRGFADDTLRQAMVACKEPTWKRIVCYNAVRVGGWVAWNHARRSTKRKQAVC